MIHVGDLPPRVPACSDTDSDQCQQMSERIGTYTIRIQIDHLGGWVVVTPDPKHWLIYTHVSFGNEQVDEGWELYRQLCDLARLDVIESVPEIVCSLEQFKRALTRDVTTT